MFLRKKKPAFTGYLITLIAITKAKNAIPSTNVRLEMTFSDPLSFVLANRSNPPFPVNALEVPSDFPPCNSDKIISKADTTINIALSI